MADQGAANPEHINLKVKSQVLYIITQDGE